MESCGTPSCHDGRRLPKWVRVSQKTHHASPANNERKFPRFSPWKTVIQRLIAVNLAVWCPSTACLAAGGVLVVAAEDEATGEPVVTRMELTRDNGKPQFIRRAAQAGLGVVVSDSLELALPDGAYQFRFVRGPEYRIITGNFSLEQTSNDQKTVRLPRMADLKAEGWLSADMAIPPATNDLTLRMIAEDLHVAAMVNEPGPVSMPQVVPKNLEPYQPLWTSLKATTSSDAGVLFYGDVKDVSGVTTEAIKRATVDEAVEVKVAVANPFAYSLPVWLATEKVDGLFVLGEWLRLDKRVESMAGSRTPRMIGFDGPRGLGRYAEFVYWNLLESGLQIAPLAGTGVTKGLSAQSPIGYNRIYATRDQETDGYANEDEVTPLESQETFMDAVWLGQSVVTNGPMLRPLLGGFPPGHRFQLTAGEKLQLMMELKLAVRDPVDYLEIVHNGKVFHSARLDEFAAAGGVLPELEIEESGWVVVRVVTQHEEHFRMATSAPWYFEVEGSPRISRKAVAFFGEWLSDCESELKKLPADELAKHVAGVTAARKFWSRRLAEATVD
jgi:hypothetical protein